MHTLLNKRKTPGKRFRAIGSMVLPIAVFIGVILLVALIAVMYMQMNSHHKQAQTAVDAAALAVAKELSRVTIEDPILGRIGVVDDYTDAGLAARPVFGINTLMARARLDLLLARRLGNTTMDYLANADSRAVAQATRRLSNQLVMANTGTIRFQDKNGSNTTLNLKEVAANAYNASGLRPASVAPITPADITIEVGRPVSSGVTGTPVPRPLARAAVDANSTAATVRTPAGESTFYRSNVPVPVPGADHTYIFSMIGDSVALVDRANFDVAGEEPAGANQPVVVPATVRVSVQETVRSLTGGAGENRPTEKKLQIAAASCGNRRITPTAGIFRLEFPQGVPARDINGVNFTTALSLMNSSQLPPGAGATTQPPGSAWNGTGCYFTAEGGPFPGNGMVRPTNVEGRTADNPSVALAFFVYDWLRHETLRPNIDAVFNALNQPLRGAQLGNDRIITDAKDFLMQSAYAQNASSNPACNVFGGIFDLLPDSTAAMAAGVDPRSLNNFNASSVNDFRDQAFVFRMQASVPQQLAYAPPTTMAHGKGPNDRPTTTDGNPVTDLLDFRQALVDQLMHGQNTAIAGAQVAQDQAAIIAAITAQIQQIVNEQNALSAQMQAALNNNNINLYNQLLNQWRIKEQQRQAKVRELEEPTRKYNRGVAAYNRGVQAVNLATSAVNNLLAITSLGVKKINSLHFRIAGNNDFFPPARAGTKGEIEGVGVVSTAQSNNARGDRNWVGNPYFLANLGATSMPDCPNSVIPDSQALNFKFTTAGDASTHPDGGVILLSIGDEVPVPITPVVKNAILNAGGFHNWISQLPPSAKNNFTQMTGISSLLEGQTQYQALNVYVEPDQVDSRLQVLWSVMAQNNVRNEVDSDVRNPEQAGNMPDCSNVDGSLNASEKSCRGEAIRFQITSPLLRCEIPIPEVQLPPPPPQLPPVPTPRVPPPPPPPRQSH
jgi:hypothetical protein